MRLAILLGLFLLGQCLALPSYKINGLFGEEDGSDSSSSSSSSSSSGDSSEDEFLENMAGWRPSGCAKGQFRSGFGTCKQCSICGPDLYEREPCQANRDTRCEWCLSGLAKSGSADFDEKCSQLLGFQDGFRRAIAQHGKRAQQLVQPASIFHFSSVQLNDSTVWKMQLAVQMAFYLALIALVLAIIRFLCKARPSATYRTVHVNPPALDEMDQKNIVRAAESIREKLGKKGYDRLEEEFI